MNSLKTEEKEKQELNCLDKLLNIMKSRDSDSSAIPNAIDKGYHLAVTHLEEEINKLKDELIEESEASKER